MGEGMESSSRGGLVGLNTFTWTLPAFLDEVSWRRYS